MQFALATTAATAALLVAERRGSRIGVWLAKPLASAGFVGAALAAGALGSGYGRWILAGLGLSFLGDVLLIPRESPRCLRAGLASFLLGHLAYTAAFALRGLDPLTWAVALAAVLAPSLLALRWLAPHLGPSLRAPVAAYLVVISVMLVCAAATVGRAGNPAIFAGALAFYASDLAVARQRFVAPAFANKAWGLPLYFGGQLLLASSAGG
jgi:uncharacterized membrane protein YhhN